jgi:ABC-type spermidine/putrescine transport system permease subunit I
VSTPVRRRAARQERRAAARGAWYPRWFWPAFAAPGVLWLALLFVLPFYVVLAIAFGAIDPLFRNPVPIWNPLQWDPSTLREVVGHIVGRQAYLGPAVARTFVFVVAASLLCLLIAYPVAYFVARYGGRRRGLFLTLLIAPFWVSYMMRMLAWVNLLEGDGLVNRALRLAHAIQQPVAWLAGRPSTVVLGLVYGYVPYMVLPLFAGLDRIEPSMLEAARDLGASRVWTFLRVTLPMSRQAILAGMVIVALPMFGDYFTNDLLSGSPKTSMVGNLVNDAIGTPGQGGQGAVLVLLLMVVLLLPMLYYVWSTSRASRESA